MERDLQALKQTSSKLSTTTVTTSTVTEIYTTTTEVTNIMMVAMPAITHIVDVEEVRLTNIHHVLRKTAMRLAKAKSMHKHKFVAKLMKKLVAAKKK